MGALDSKKVFVMGATSGIGLATAMQAVAEGAQVWGASRSEEKLERARALVPGAEFRQLDTHDAAGIRALCDEIGPLDHVVAAATGADRTMAPFMDQTDEQFREAFNKFWGYCNIVRQAVPSLVESGSITLVSGVPARKCNPGMSSVSCTGAAVEALVRALALELAPLRVNVVAPGIIDTGMFDRFGDKKAEVLAQMGKSMPLGRVGRAEEVASAIIQTLVNTYMTGTTLDVDGGSLLP